MNRRRFTKSETVALCVLVAALLAATCTMMPSRSSGNELAAVAAADSVYRAKADSLDRHADSLRKAAAAQRAAVRDSQRQVRSKKKAAKEKNEFQPRRRNYLDETLSPTEAR